MKIKNYLLVAALATSLAGTSALAANGDRSGMAYLGVQGGPSWIYKNDLGIPSANANTGFVIGGDLGYQFTSNLRADLSFDYTRNTLKVPGINDDHFNQLDILVNGYYDIPMDGFIPYLGAGLGYAHRSFGKEVAGVSHTTDGLNGFGWQVGAGLKVALDEIDLGLGYRLMANHFKDETDTVYNNSVLAELTFYFGGI